MFRSRVQSTLVASSLLNLASLNDSDGTLETEQSVRMEERCWIASRAPGCAFICPYKLVMYSHVDETEQTKK